MRFFVAVTDNRWFSYLSDLQPDEVNFWRPSGQLFRSIDTGAPLLFKLHSPMNYIVGGGFFVRSERLPLSIAWDAFGEKNGASSLNEFQRLVRAHRRDDEHDPQIGCVILNEPFFFPQDNWLPVPSNWAPNIVAGKTYDSNDSIGRELWEQAAQLISDEKRSHNEFELALAEGPRFGNEYLTRGRLGQGAFRILVTSAYERRCAVTGEKTLPVLQAAHIRPFVDNGPNAVRNGILLRSDLHILFDRGYVTVTPERIVEVSGKIKDEFENGKEYYPFHGHSLQILPEAASDRPQKEYLEWHNENVYLG